MANVHDVASYILQKCGSMTAMKLQKLAYYSKAWHLVWEEASLFDSEIQAWANGPVIPDLYREHKGKFWITEWIEGDSTRLSEDERTSIDAVLVSYGEFTAQQLSELTHQERPWIEGREGLTREQRGSSPISDASIHEYYSGRTRV